MAETIRQLEREGRNVIAKPCSNYAASRIPRPEFICVGEEPVEQDGELRIRYERGTSGGPTGEPARAEQL